MPNNINLTVTPPVAPLVTIKPASVFVSLGNVVGAVGSGSSQYSVQGTGAPGNPYQLVGDAATPGNWQFYGTNGSGVKGWLAQGASTQFSIVGSGVPGTPLQLSGDVASPGNNQFYGTNSGGARGFYPLPSITTQDSIQGGGPITSGLTFQLVGDVVLPSNGQFYGYSGSARGWFTPPTATAIAGGYVPVPPNNTTTFLRGDATFATPPSATATVAGYVPTPPNNTTTFLRGDATFAAITGTAETLVSTNLGTVSTNQTVNCAGACAVHIRITISAAVTLTLTNLLVGVPVSIAIAATGSFTLKFAATNPSSTAYAIQGYNPGTGTAADLVATGINLTSTSVYVYVGNSANVSATPTLDLTL